MMDKYDSEVKIRLLTLSNDKKLIFANLTCELLYPNYLYFSKKYNWGEPQILLNGISLIYQYFFNKQVFDEEDITEMMEQIDLATPDTEDFSCIEVSFALDACSAIYSTLEFLIDKENEHIADVAIFARDTVDMYVREKDDINGKPFEIENVVEQSSFMISEKKRQKELISLLDGLKKVDDIELHKLREKQKPIIDFSLLN